MGVSKNVALLSLMAKIDKQSVTKAAAEYGKTAEEALSNVSSNMSDAFGKEMTTAFEEALKIATGKLKGVNLSSYTESILSSLFSEKELKEKEKDLETFIKNMTNLSKSLTGLDSGSLNSMNMKQLDAVIAKQEKILEKEQEIANRRKQLEDSVNGIGSKKSTPQAISKKYLSSDYEKSNENLKKLFTTEKAFSKDQEKSIKDLSKMLTLYSDMEKVQPEKGTTKAIQYNRELLTVVQEINKQKDKIDKFTGGAATNFVSENFASIGKVTPYTVELSKQDYVKENLKTLNAQKTKLEKNLTTYITDTVQKNLQKASNEAEKVVGQAAKRTEKLQGQIDKIKGADSSDKPLIGNVVDKSQVKSLDEIEERLYDLQEKYSDPDEPLSNKALKEYISLYKQYEAAIDNDPELKLDPDLKQMYTDIISADKAMRDYADSIQFFNTEQKKMSVIDNGGENSEISERTEQLREQEQQAGRTATAEERLSETQQTSIEVLKQDLETTKGQIEDLSTRLTSLESDNSFSSLSGQVKTVTENITALTDKVNELFDSLKNSKEINALDVLMHGGNLDILNSSDYKKSDGLSKNIHRMFSKAGFDYGMVTGGGIFGTNDMSGINKTDVSPNTKWYAIDYSKYYTYMVETEEEAEELNQFMQKVNLAVIKNLGVNGEYIAPSFQDMYKDIDIEGLFQEYQKSFKGANLSLDEFKNVINELSERVKKAGFELYDDNDKKSSFTGKNAKVSDEHAYDEDISTMFYKKHGYQGVNFSKLNDQFYNSYFYGSTIFDIDKNNPYFKVFDTYEQAVEYMGQIRNKIDNNQTVFYDYVDKSNDKFKKDLERTNELLQEQSRLIDEIQTKLSKTNTSEMLQADSPDETNISSASTPATQQVENFQEELEKVETQARETAQAVEEVGNAGSQTFESKSLESEIEEVIHLSNELKELFSLLKNSENEIYALIGEDSTISKITSGMNGKVSAEDIYKNMLSTLENQIFANIHNHPGGNPVFSGDDLSGISNNTGSYENGNNVYGLLAKDNIKFIDFSGVDKQIATEFINEYQKAEKEIKSSIDPLLSDKDWNIQFNNQMSETFDLLLSKYNISDIVKNFNIADTNSIAEYLLNIESTASSALSPVQKLINLVEYGSEKKLDLNSDNIKDVLDLFNSGNLSGVQTFTKLMHEVGSKFSVGVSDEISKFRSQLKELLGQEGYQNNFDEFVEYEDAIFDKAKTATEALEALKKEKSELFLSSQDQMKDAFQRENGSENATKIKENLDVESEGMQEVEVATEEATDAKKEFVTANEAVQSSIDDSENPLKLEAELMDQIAKSAREAADAKKEFAEANKQVKDSADNSNVNLQSGHSENVEPTGVKKYKKRGYKARDNKSHDNEIKVEGSKTLEEALRESQNKIASGLNNNVEAIKKITDFYDSNNNLVKTQMKVIDAENKRQTTYTTSYSLDEGGNATAWTSHIDTQKYDTENKAIQEQIKNLQKLSAEKKKTTASKRQSEYNQATKQQLDAYKEIQKIRKEIATTSDAGVIEELNGQKKIQQEIYLQATKQLKSFDDLYDSEARFNALKDVELKTTNEINKALAKQNAKKLESMQSGLGDYQSYLQQLNKRSDNDQSTQYKQKLESYTKALSDYATKLKKFQEDSNLVVTDEDIKNLEKAKTNLDELKDSFKAMEKGSSAISRDKLIYQITDYMDKNSSISKEFRVELEKIINDLKTMGANANIKDLADQFFKLKSKIKEAGQEGKKFWDIIFEKAKYGLAAQIGMYFGFNDIVRYVREGIQTVTELDTAMTEVRKVSSATEAQYKSFQKTIASTAKEIASTNVELINSSADFLRLGYSLEQAENLAKNASLFVNVGDGVDIDEATEDMITAMKAFDIQAEDSIKIVDSYNQIGNLYALSASDIGEAMKRSASALEVGNNTFEESIGMITAMNEIIQDSETTGTSLKVLSLRLRGASAELESMNEDTDGLCDSTSKLREQIKALSGVDIMVDDNTFKSTAQQVKELGAVFEDLDDTSQAALLEIIAGKSRSNAVAALLKNYKQIDEVIADLDDAEGSALKENQAIVDSIEGRIQILSATAEEFWQTFID